MLQDVIRGLLVAKNIVYISSLAVWNPSALKIILIQKIFINRETVRYHRASRHILGHPGHISEEMIHIVVKNLANNFQGRAGGRQKLQIKRTS